MTSGADLFKLEPILTQRVHFETRGFREAKIAAAKFRREFRVKLPRLRYEKVLGRGGFGMVQLWRILGDPNGRKVAIKFPLKERLRFEDLEGVQKEVRFMCRLFHGLEHFIQPVEVERVKNPKDKLTNNPDVDRPIIVMEALGVNLHQLISWVNESRLWWRRHARGRRYTNIPIEVWDQHKLGYIPNRVLWIWFSCLLKAVVGMAYPPRGFETYANFTPPMNNDHLERPTKEAIPAPNEHGRVPVESTFIHFDLDPRNVLIGDRDYTEHSDIPKLKISDFGISIMFNLITLRHPNRVDKWYPQSRFVRIPGGRNTNVASYGWALLGSGVSGFLKGYDLELRELICRCMARNTNDRPSLGELWEAISTGLSNSYENERRFTQKAEDHMLSGKDYDPMMPHLIESELTIAQFYEDYFTKPPQKPDPSEGKWGESDQGPTPVFSSSHGSDSGDPGPNWSAHLDDEPENDRFCVIM
ncbi:kinase-like protein [Rostrohypoxylon terebratum]|nr:kinase-like protein [Rostrohypoxylon terebratum]